MGQLNLNYKQSFELRYKINMTWQQTISTDPLRETENAAAGGELHLNAIFILL